MRLFSNKSYSYLFLLVSISALFLSSCSTVTTTRESSLQPSLQNDQDSCTYYNFLIGNRAELQDDPEAALSAYKRALECSSHSGYLETKVPLMLIRMGNFDSAISEIEKNLKDEPHQKGLALLLASLYTQQGKTTKAIQLYNDFLQNNPEETATLLRLGLLYLENEQYTLAEKTFLTSLKIDPTSYYAHLYLAHTYRATNNKNKAIDYYTKTLQLNWSTQLCYEIGEFYFERHLYGDALDTYNQILNYDRGEEQAFFYKINTLAKLEKYEEAFTSLKNRRSYSNNPENIDLTIATLLIDQGKELEGIAKLEQLVDRYPSGRAAHTLALYYYDNESYELSHQWLDKITFDNPLHSQSLLLKLQIFIEEERYTEAIELLSSQIDNNDPNANLYNMLSSLYQTSNQPDMAEEIYKEGLTLLPADPAISYEYALFLDKQDRSLEGLEVMEKLLEIDPNNAEALNFVGYTWADNFMHLEKALEYTTRASELKPENGYIRDSVGWCYYRLNDFPRAVIELELAVQLAPKDPHIIDHLGDAYAANKQFTEALDAYIKALNLQKNEAKKKSIQEKIDALKY